MNNDIETLLNAAFDAYNQSDFERAEALVRDVLNAQPAHGDGLYLLALIAYQAHALDPAADLLYQAVKLYPDVDRYQLTLASVLQEQGHLDEALNRYLKYPNNPLAQTQCGFIYILKNQYDFARSAFIKALSCSPDLDPAILGMAQYEFYIGEGDKAIKRLEKRSEEVSNFPDLFSFLASMYRQKGHFEKAYQSIQKAISLAPTAVNHLECGLILEGQGQFCKALESYQQAVKLNPYLSDAWANLGNVYHHLSQNKLAEDAYKRALQQDLEHEQAHHNLAVLLQEEKRLTEALEHYRSVLSHNPSHLPSLYNLAVIQEQNDEPEEALGLYFNILIQNGDFSDLKWRIVDTLNDLSQKGNKEHKRALTFAKGWVKNFPDDPIAIHTLAALKGEKEKVFPLAYVKNLYDHFADTYDSKMSLLQVKVLPKLISMLPNRGYSGILDLGCGTGKFAELWDAPLKYLVGVDCSKKMIQKAHRQEKYTDLISQDIVSFLKEDTQKYDLIVASELFCYLSDIKEVFSLVQLRLNQTGVFAFSVETSTSEDITLAETGRYLYSDSYIKNCLARSGFSIISDCELPLRREGDGYAQGRLYVVSKVSPF